MFPALLANKKKMIIIGASSLVLIIAVVIVIVCCVNSKKEEAYRTRAEIEKDIEEIRAKETALIDELYEIAVAQEKMAKKAEATPVDYEIEVAKKDMAKKAEVPPVEAQMVDATPVDDKVTVTVNKIEDATVSNVKTVDNKFNTASLLPVETVKQEQTKTYKLDAVKSITDFEKEIGKDDLKALDQKDLIKGVNDVNIVANEIVAIVTAKGLKSDATKYRSYTNKSKLTEREYNDAKALEKKDSKHLLHYAESLNRQNALRNVLRNQSQSLKPTDARYKLLRTCAEGLDKDILITDDGKYGQNIHDKAKIMPHIKTSDERMSKFKSADAKNYTTETKTIIDRFEDIKKKLADKKSTIKLADLNNIVNYIDKGYLNTNDYKAARRIDITPAYMIDLIEVKLDAKALIKAIQSNKKHAMSLKNEIKKLETLKL